MTVCTSDVYTGNHLVPLADSSGVLTGFLGPRTSYPSYKIHTSSNFQKHSQANSFEEWCIKHLKRTEELSKLHMQSQRLYIYKMYNLVLVMPSLALRGIPMAGELWAGFPWQESRALTHQAPGCWRPQFSAPRSPCRWGRGPRQGSAPGPSRACGWWRSASPPTPGWSLQDKQDTLGNTPLVPKGHRTQQQWHWHRQGQLHRVSHSMGHICLWDCFTNKKGLAGSWQGQPGKHWDRQRYRQVWNFWVKEI